MKCEICGKEAKYCVYGVYICENNKCLEEAKKLSYARHKNRVVAVGSKNPVKVEGTKEAFEKVLGYYEVVGVEVDSSVSPHPIGLEETYLGALNRAKNAFEKIDCCYSVGIEAGMIKIGNHYLDVHIAVVYDGVKETVGISQGFEYPMIAVNRILNGEEGCKIAEEISGIKDIGKKVGFIGYLTDNNITRKDLIRESVIMALIPRMKKNLILFQI
ncbi:inosine/xanthosine triphosphatase [Methanocaldococcus indicus]|uniref:inosine/xanthosine triphosphatase n=1 Tax=Methanocaldococcus indicus TaxID=213231 RepID=UPI003C6D558D